MVFVASFNNREEHILFCDITVISAFLRCSLSSIAFVIVGSFATMDGLALRIRAPSNPAFVRVGHSQTVPPEVLPCAASALMSSSSHTGAASFASFLRRPTGDRAFVDTAFRWIGAGSHLNADTHRLSQLHSLLKVFHKNLWVVRSVPVAPLYRIDNRRISAVQLSILSARYNIYRYCAEG